MLYSFDRWSLHADPVPGSMVQSIRQHLEASRSRGPGPHTPSRTRSAPGFAAPASQALAPWRGLGSRARSMCQGRRTLERRRSRWKPRLEALPQPPMRSSPTSSHPPSTAQQQPDSLAQDGPASGAHLKHRPRLARRPPTAYRHLRIPQAASECEAQWGPRLPSRGRSCQGRQEPVRPVAPQRRHQAPNRRLVVRHLAAWKASRCSRRFRILGLEVLSKTTRPRRRHRQGFAMPERSIHPPCAAVFPGRSASRHPPWKATNGLLVRSGHSVPAATAGPPSWRLRSPRWWSCPCATEPIPAGRHPRSGRVEIRPGPAGARYRDTATPETGSPSTFHRPVLVPGRHRARSSRPRVTLPRCRPSPWCPPAAMPTSPTDPALVPVRLPDLWCSGGAAARVRTGAC